MYNKIFLLAFLPVLMIISGCGSDSMSSEPSHSDTAAMQDMNPAGILFTTPTINDALPQFIEKTDTCFFLHEDEWRQVEFISKEQRNLIDQEIAKIKDIIENESYKGENYTGYKNIAVRNLISVPLSINLSKLEKYLSDGPVKKQGLEIENNSGQVKGGFSFTINGVNYYGVTDNNIVRTFGIYTTDNNQNLKTITNELAKLSASEKLYLVDWRTMQVFDETNIHTDLVK